MAKKNKSLSPNENIELLITIVNREERKYFIKLMENFDVTTQFSILGNGTASSEILDLLGLVESEKIIILSFVRKSKIHEIFTLLHKELSTHGKGIAFSVPLTSMVGITLYKFISKQLGGNNEQ